MTICLKIYRCWIVWGRSYLVTTLPIVLSLTSLYKFFLQFFLQIDPNLYLTMYISRINCPRHRDWYQRNG